VLHCVALCCSVLQWALLMDASRCCGVLQYVAVCCSVLRCVAVCCSVLHCVAVSCSMFQCVAVCCSALQWALLMDASRCCTVLQCVAVCCSVLQCVAVQDSTWSTAKFMHICTERWVNIFFGISPPGREHQSWSGSRVFVQIFVSSKKFV